MESWSYSSSISGDIDPATTFPISNTTMAMDPTVEPFFKGSTGRNTRGLLRLTILCLIAGAAVSSRLFSVIRMLIPKAPPRWTTTTTPFVDLERLRNKA